MRPLLPYEKGWYDVPEQCPVVGVLNIFIPQIMYMPYSDGDIRRYNSPVYRESNPPIIFGVKDPFEWGIALIDALNNRMDRLVHKDERMNVFEGSGEKLRLRLQVGLIIIFFHFVSLELRSLD